LPFSAVATLDSGRSATPTGNTALSTKSSWNPTRAKPARSPRGAVAARSRWERSPADYRCWKSLAQGASGAVNRGAVAPFLTQQHLEPRGKVVVNQRRSDCEAKLWPKVCWDSGAVVTERPRTSSAKPLRWLDSPTTGLICLRWPTALIASPSEMIATRIA
jgi:hypothetical protein